MTECAFGVPPHVNPASLAIDRSVLGEWLGDDDTAIDELLAVFAGSIAGELNHMGDLFAANDLPAFAKAAHRLRGAALSMGARSLAAAAATLDAAARSGDAGAIAAGFPALRVQVDKAIAEVPRLH